MEENISPDVYDQASGNNDNMLGNEDIECKQTGHALLNVVVLDRVIRYLKYEEIQNCRLVCQRWNEVFETDFWKLSRIKIKHKIQSKSYFLITSKYEEENQKLIQDFKSTFPFSGLPLNEIVFEGVIDYSLLDYFWKERGSTQLTRVYFRDVFDRSCIFIDVSRYVTRNLTTLHLRYVDTLSKSKIIISLEMLSNIQKLCVEYCQIVLNGKIAPKELTMLKRNTVSHNGVLFDFFNPRNRRQRILINDFVDFSNIKKLCLRGNIWRLDLSIGAPHLENLDIDHGIELVGRRDSQWKTNLLNFGNNIYIGDRMELKWFSLADVYNVDLGSLPTNVEVISICYHLQLVVPQIFACPKLTYISLYISKNFDFPVLNFANCTSMVDFQLKYRDEHRNIDFKQIIFPNCIKRVKLCHIEKPPDGDGPNWQLDKLILSECSLSFAEKFLKNVRSVKLTLDLSTMTPEDEISILNLWKNINVQRLAFGSHYSNITKNSDEFLKNVDKAGSYYLFNKKVNGKGNAINMSRFRSLCVLSSHEYVLDTIYRTLFHKNCKVCCISELENSTKYLNYSFKDFS